MEMVMDDTFDWIAAINTANIKRPIITLNPKRIVEEYDCTPEEIIFFLFHEIEHLKEDADLHVSRNGSSVFAEREKRLLSRGIFAKAFHEFENYLRDAYVDREVMSVKNAPVLKWTIESNYTDKLFKETNLQKAPFHVQFQTALLRESIIRREVCTVDPKVRRELRSLANSGVANSLIAGSLDNRLSAIWKYAEPIFAEFLEEDLKNYQNQKKKEKDQKKIEEETRQWAENALSQNQPQDQNSPKPPDVQESFSAKPEWGTSQPPSQGGDPSKCSKPIPSEDTPSDKAKDWSWGEWEETDETPKNPFEDYCIKPTPHILESHLSDEDKAKLRESIEAITRDKNRARTEEEMRNELRAKNLGVDPNDERTFVNIIRTLKEYDRFLEQLEKVRDPETGNFLIDEIENIFSRIASNRKKPRFHSRGPVDMEIGEWLYGSALAEGYASIETGDRDPEVFELYDLRLRERMYVWNFDVTIVADGTGSMQWEKNREQKVAILLMFEWLRRLHDRLEDMRSSLAEPIDFTTEGFIFGSKSRKIKEASSTFEDRERLEVYKALDEDNGPKNNEWLLLEKMYLEFERNTPNDIKEKIKQGKIKKIIFILTDGGQDVSAYESKLREYIAKFRTAWVLVYGVWITRWGSSVVDLYGWSDRALWYGEVCDRAEDLAKTLKDMLSEHLEIV